MRDWQCKSRILLFLRLSQGAHRRMANTQNDDQTTLFFDIVTFFRLYDVKQ